MDQDGKDVSMTLVPSEYENPTPPLRGFMAANDKWSWIIITTGWDTDCGFCVVQIKLRVWGIVEFRFQHKWGMMLTLVALKGNTERTQKHIKRVTFQLVIPIWKQSLSNNNYQLISWLYGWRL